MKKVLLLILCLYVPLVPLMLQGNGLPAMDFGSEQGKLTKFVVTPNDYGEFRGVVYSLAEKLKSGDVSFLQSLDEKNMGAYFHKSKKANPEDFTKKDEMILFLSAKVLDDGSYEVVVKLATGAKSKKFAADLEKHFKKKKAKK